MTQPGYQSGPTSPAGGSPYNNASQILNYNKKTNHGLFSNNNLDPNGDNENIAMTKRLSAGMYPGLASGVGFYNEMMPVRNQGIKSALRVLDPRADTQAKIDVERNRNDAVAKQQIAQMSANLAEQGYGSGAIASATRGMQDQSAEATMDYQDQLNDPEYQSAMWQQYMSMVDQGLEIPGMEEFLAMTGAGTDWTKFRKASQQQGGGILGGMGGLLGGAASAYFGGTGPFAKKPGAA